MSEQKVVFEFTKEFNNVTPKQAYSLIDRAIKKIDPSRGIGIDSMDDIVAYRTADTECSSYRRVVNGVETHTDCLTGRQQVFENDVDDYEEFCQDKRCDYHTYIKTADHTYNLIVEFDYRDGNRGWCHYYEMEAFAVEDATPSTSLEKAEASSLEKALKEEEACSIKEARALQILEPMECELKKEFEEAIGMDLDDISVNMNEDEIEDMIANVGPKLCLSAVRQNGLALEFLPLNLVSYEICMEAVKQNGLALEFVPGEMKNPKICMEAVKQNGLALEFVPKDMLLIS
jgi:hypothetical protein